MANQLFIVCPLSCMETYLQCKYGNDIFFLTFSGAVIQFQEFDYFIELRDFIVREKIQTIYIVNDTSCRIINGIIKRNKIAGFQSENVIEELYVDNYLTDFIDKSLFNQQSKLAELNVKNQINRIINSTLLGSYISEFDIEVKGLITSKEKKLYNEIQISNTNRIHEF